MDLFIKDLVVTADAVGARKRSRKKLRLSFDEWNVWYRARGGVFANGQRKFAPPLLEEVYNLEDALLVGGFLNTLLRQSERVRVGCLAQIVNVIAPLMTNATSVLRQTIYYPYAWALRYAHGRVLDLHVESETYPIRAAGLRPDFARDGQVPYLDVTATFDPRNGQLCLLMLNRDLQNERDLTLDCREVTPTRVLASETLTGTDLKAANTFAQPTQVTPRALEAPAPATTMTFKLPARSYSVVHLATS
jgi:alpha-N-arabinofuranosidase